MEMTFRQYIDNPLGKKNAVFSQREMFKALYTGKFDKVLMREAGKINYTLYHDKKKDEYLCHIKIPSEVINKFYYDVVILFYTTNNALRTATSLEDYFVKFYSNDPAFVFTYLRVFLKNKMFVEDLREKSPKQALKEDPKIRNPYEIPGYVKSLYFAYLYMKLKNLLLKVNYDMYGKAYDKKMLIASVEHADKKIAERQEAGDKLEKEKSKKRSDSITKQNADRFSTSKHSPSSTVGRVGSVKTISRIGSHNSPGAIGSVKRVKNIKKI